MPKVNWITGVYKITNMINKKVYIGSASKSLLNRIRDHKRCLNGGYHYNRHLQGAWNLYGPAAFKFSIIERCRPSDCLVREQYWMDYYNSYNPNFGYNIRCIAESNFGIKWSPETRERMSEAAKRRLQRPDQLERHLQMSLKAAKAYAAKYKGKPGRKQTEETKKKISSKLKGVKKSPEAVAKTANSQRGRKMSEEQKLKISLAKRGKKLSEEHKAKISAGLRKKMKEDMEFSAHVANLSNIRWYGKSI